MRNCETIIVIPTLDPIVGARCAAEARSTAGVQCGIIIASDYEKRGAVVVSNVLVRAALDWGAKYICYVNDDVSEFPENWLKRLIEAVDKQPHYGSASAGGKCRGGPQAKARPGLPPLIIETRHPLAWFCTVIKAEVFNSVVMFDEKLTHYADDSDFQFRMVELGWLNAYVQDVFVRHDAGKPIQPWWDQDLGRLRRKWNL